MPNDEPKIFGLAAEFTSAEAILRAAERVRSAGYSHAEAYTPVPVKGLSEQLGFGKTRIPLICFVGGVLGLVAAFALCWYANVISYPWIVANRPLNSWPAFITITIDGMIAGAFFSALVAMLLLNGLPRLNHPLFNLEAFSRATQDRYFLCIEADDRNFDLHVTRSFLATLEPAAIHTVSE